MACECPAGGCSASLAFKLLECMHTATVALALVTVTVAFECVAYRIVTPVCAPIINLLWSTGIICIVHDSTCTVPHCLPVSGTGMQTGCVTGPHVAA